MQRIVGSWLHVGREEVLHRHPQQGLHQRTASCQGHLHAQSCRQSISQATFLTHKDVRVLLERPCNKRCSRQRARGWQSIRHDLLRGAWEKGSELLLLQCGWGCGVGHSPGGVPLLGSFQRVPVVLRLRLRCIGGGVPHDRLALG